MDGAWFLIMVKFYGAMFIIYLMAPQLMHSFNEYKKAGQLGSQVHWLTAGFVLMLVLAGLAFNGPPIQ